MHLLLFSTLMIKDLILGFSRFSFLVAPNFSRNPAILSILLIFQLIPKHSRLLKIRSCFSSFQRKQFFQHGGEYFCNYDGINWFINRVRVKVMIVYCKISLRTLI